MTKRSGFEIKFRVEMVDGTEYEVRAGIADAVRFEVTHKRPVTDDRGRIQIADLMWLAWAASYRQKIHKVARFDDWYPQVHDADQIDPPEPPKPDAEGADAGDASSWPDGDADPTESPEPETS